jgi:hypothetical protein
MSNITTDFITATKKIHADVRAILMALHLIGKDVKVIKEQHNADPEHNISGEEHEGVRAPHSPKQKANTYEAKQYALDKLRFGLEKKAFHVGAWTIVILAIYTLLTGYQSCQSKKAADAATRALIASNRSWIEIRMPKNWEDAHSPEEGLVQLRALDELAFNLSYTNIGKFPLREILLEANVDIVDSITPVVFDYARAHQVETENVLFPGRADNIPAQDAVRDFETVKVTDDLRYDLIEGKKYLAIYVRGHFMDDFGIHWVQFCAALTFKKNQYYSRKNCVDYNDTGDGERKP